MACVLPQPLALTASRVIHPAWLGWRRQATQPWKQQPVKQLLCLGSLEVPGRRAQPLVTLGPLQGLPPVGPELGPSPSQVEGGGLGVTEAPVACVLVWGPWTSPNRKKHSNNANSLCHRLPQPLKISTSALPGRKGSGERDDSQGQPGDCSKDSRVSELGRNYSSSVKHSANGRSCLRRLRDCLRS